MRFAIFTFLFAFLTTAAMAVAPHKSVIISYPNDTPQSVVDEAMAKIEKDGGRITHKYSTSQAFFRSRWWVNEKGEVLVKSAGRSVTLMGVQQYR
jgi:hypothetical protein